MRISPRLPLAAALALFALVQTSSALDWPQFRGPNRDDVSKETGLLKQWPAEGPKRVWIFNNAGNGYSGPAIVAGRLYTLGIRDGKENLLALDANTGKELWHTALGDVLKNNWGDGPRSTPSVDGDKVYALSGPGNLVCADAKTGRQLWSKQLTSLGGKVQGWGYTESPLVDGNQVVCTPGGPQGTMAAFDKATGKVLWQSKDWTEMAQYSSIVKAEINKQPTYVQLVMNSFAGVDPKTGKVLWKDAFPNGKTAVIPTPIVSENNVFVNAGYGAGCKMVQIRPGNHVEQVYENKTMKNHHGGVLLFGKHLYGYSDGIGWLCMDFATGEQVWAERQKLGKGAVSCADGMLYCLDEGKGTVVLVDASPKGWNEHGRLTLEPQSSIRSPQGRIWTHPVISNGKLYLRDQEFIYCFDVKG
jgi:outer membrane protein assembly factor BamB